MTLLYKFILNFTPINTLRWDDVVNILNHRISVQEVAFLRVCHLPLSYLKQHAPQYIHDFVKYSKTIPWTVTPEPMPNTNSESQSTHSF